MSRCLGHGLAGWLAEGGVDWRVEFAGGPGFLAGYGQDSLSQVVSVRSFTAVVERGD